MSLYSLCQYGTVLPFFKVIEIYRNSSKFKQFFIAFTRAQHLRALSLVYAGSTVYLEVVQAHQPYFRYAPAPQRVSISVCVLSVFD